MSRIAPIAAAISLWFCQPGFGHGDLHEVIGSVSAELSEKPDDPALLLRRAELLRLHGEFAAAEADYRAVERLRPDLAAVELGLAELRLAQGREDAALELLDRFLSECPEHAEGHLLRAVVLERRGEEKKAEKDFSAAAGFSTEPHYVTALADFLVRHNQADAAIRCLDAASAARGGVPVLEQRALEIEEQSGRTAAALNRLDRFIAREPRPDIWLVRKARLLEANGENAEAVGTWRLAAVAFEAVPAEKRELDLNRKIHAQIVAGLGSPEEGRP